MDHNALKSRTSRELRVGAKLVQSPNNKIQALQKCITSESSQSNGERLIDTGKIVNSNPRDGVTRVYTTRSSPSTVISR